MGKTCKSCTNCQTARRACERPSPDEPCLRCVSQNLKCTFAISKQGQRNDLTSSPIGSSSKEKVVAKLSKPVRIEVISSAAVKPPLVSSNSADKEGVKDSSSPPSSNTKLIGKTHAPSTSQLVGKPWSTSKLVSNNDDDIVTALDNNNNAPANSTHGLSAYASTSSDQKEEVPLYTSPSLPGGCIGHRSIFEVANNSKHLIKYTISSRPMHNEQCKNVAFIENTTFLNKKMKRNCCGAIITYGITSPADKRTYYYLGIIGGLFYRTQKFNDNKLNTYDGALYVYEFDGDTTIIDDGIVPTFFTKEFESEIMKHLTLRIYKFNKSDPIDMHFVNQFSGALPLGMEEFAPELVNHIDLCLQCSPDGGDFFPTQLRRIKNKEDYLKALPRLPVTSSDTEHPPVIKMNNAT